MQAENKRYKLIMLTRRIKMPGIVETMSEQVPEVRIAFGEIEEMLAKRLDSFAPDEWRIISHAQNIHNGILIVTFMLESMLPAVS